MLCTKCWQSCLGERQGKPRGEGSGGFLEETMFQLGFKESVPINNYYYYNINNNHSKHWLWTYVPGPIPSILTYLLFKAAL